MIANRFIISSAILVLAVSLMPNSSVAQTDPMRMARMTSANQVGIMEYCQGKGWADQAAVEAQRKAAASLPAATDTTGVGDAEAAGRKGDLLNNGTPISIASMAGQTHTTEQDLCSRMASAAKMVAAQQSSMPAFPSMPGGTAMPALPPGMKMPTMPGVPKTP